MLEPGRQLDALVAEKVMGITGCRMPRYDYPLSGPKSRTIWAEGRYPAYSTDIAAAWQVVEKLDLLGSCIIPGWESYGPVYRTLCHIENREWMISDDRDLGWTIRAETAPHAICLAALKAVSA